MGSGTIPSSQMLQSHPPEHLGCQLPANSQNHTEKASPVPQVPVLLYSPSISAHQPRAQGCAMGSGHFCHCRAGAWVPTRSFRTLLIASKDSPHRRE